MLKTQMAAFLCAFEDDVDFGGADDAVGVRIHDLCHGELSQSFAKGAFNATVGFDPEPRGYSWGIRRGEAEAA